jgi:hypothetical protein
MKYAILIKIILITSLYISFLSARPISYKDSWTVISNNDYFRNSVLIHYSPKSTYSTGFISQYWQEKKYWINAFNLNYLVKRINRKSSQANLYLKGGVGMLSTNYNSNDKNELVYYNKLAADWETRKHLVSYENSFIKPTSIKNTYMQKFRIGKAPYVAKYGELHTWLIYELVHIPDRSSKYISNFILRLFKSTNLIEIGLDEDKTTSLNFIKRF